MEWEGQMNIAHYKITPIAMSPESIVDVINKYTDNYAYVFGYSYPCRKLLPNIDVLHQHNVDQIEFDKKIIQYHSEPFRVTLNSNGKKCVVAQYHATLPEYKNCSLVRNPIDIYNIEFLPKYTDKRIRIAYSPSTIKPQSKWADKGYELTIGVLEKIKEKYGNYVDVDIITNVSLKECLLRKSMANVFIDEVVTPSYHRSGLEALAMGILTICSIGKEVENIMLTSSGANLLPFENIESNNLESSLDNIIEKGIEWIQERGFQARRWMEKYWDPEDIAEEYISLYRDILNK